MLGGTVAEYVLPGARRRSSPSWRPRLRTTERCGGHRRHPAPRDLGLRPRRGHRRPRSASPCRGSRSCAAAVGLADHGPPDHALDRLVPAGHPAVQAHRGRRSLFVVVLGAAPSIANGAHPRRRPHPAAAAAGRAGPRRARASPPTATSSCPAALPTFVGRPQAGLGLRLAQPDGRRAARRSSPTSPRSVRLQLARDLLDAPPLLATMIVILVIGILVDSLVFSTLERRSAPGGASSSRRGLLCRPWPFRSERRRRTAAGHGSIGWCKGSPIGAKSGRLPSPSGLGPARVERAGLAWTFGFPGCRLALDEEGFPCSDPAR